MSVTKASRPGKWYRKDVILLFASLNFHTYKIQQELIEEEKHGIGWAAELLSDCLSNECTPSRVARKISTIWESKGAEGSRLVDVYRHGACPRTLPLLDQTLLQDIAITVRNMQKFVFRSPYKEPN
jgi:hypothetical protein